MPSADCGRALGDTGRLSQQYRILCDNYIWNYVFAKIATRFIKTYLDRSLLAAACFFMTKASSRELKGLHAFVPVRPPRTPRYYLLWGLQLIVSPILFPFRLLAVLLSFAISSVSLRILTFKLDLTKPINPFRRTLIRLQTMLFTRLFVWALGCRVVEKDVQNKPDLETDHVVIYNHTNSLDGAILAMLGFTSHINKASILKMPIFGLVEISNQGLFVDRNDSSSKQKAQKAIQERALLASGPLGLPRVANHCWCTRGYYNKWDGSDNI